MAIPAGQLGLAGGSGGAVEGGQQEVLPNREALVALGEVGVDQFHQAKPSGLVVEGGNLAEGQDFGLLRWGRRLGFLDSLEDLVAILEGQRHRFFEEDVLAGLRGCHRQGSVG